MTFSGVMVKKQNDSFIARGYEIFVAGEKRGIRIFFLLFFYPYIVDSIKARWVLCLMKFSDPSLKGLI